MNFRHNAIDPAPPHRAFAPSPGVIQLAAASAATYRAAIWPVAVIGIGLIGTLDYLAGTEVRTFPLYFVPISLLAWHRGRIGAVCAAMLCAMAWLGSNVLAGLQYSQGYIWFINTAVQAACFATAGILIASLREWIASERAVSRIDPLTLLLNAHAFCDDAKRLVSLCHRKRYAFTMAYVDLDKFKDVNDRLGHRAGDEVLRGVAHVFRHNLRPSDLVARLGGDEFAIFLPHTDASGATPMLERLRSELKSAFESAPVPVTASIGAVSFVTTSNDVEEMVHAADACMYSAKRQGGDRARITVVSGETAARTGHPLTSFGAVN